MSVQLNSSVGAVLAKGAVAPVRATDADEELVAAARRGDPAAFEKLLARHEARIFRLAHNITQNREDAEEVTQDAFLRAFLRLDTFQGESRFSTWLTRIAINQALMKLRKHKPGVLPLDEPVETAKGSLPREIVDWGPSPEQRFSQRELRELLDGAIGELNTNLRIVLQLRDLEEFSTEETARALGISIAAVKSRLMRARLELREKLNGYFALPAAAAFRRAAGMSIPPVFGAAGAD